MKMSAHLFLLEDRGLLPMKKSSQILKGSNHQVPGLGRIPNTPGAIHFRNPGSGSCGPTTSREASPLTPVLNLSELSTVPDQHALAVSPAQT